MITFILLMKNLHFFRKKLQIRCILTGAVTVIVWVQ